MVEPAKERARVLGRSLRPASFARWDPNWLDLLVVGLSWVLVVVAALRTATTVVTAERGLLYFAGRYQRKRDRAAASHAANTVLTKAPDPEQWHHS